MVENQQSTDSASIAGVAAITRKRLNRPVTRARLEKALRILAGIIAEGSHQYLPVFLRVEKELASCSEQEEAIQRAKAISVREPNPNQETNLHTF